jgi:hypothetical protein
MGCREFGSSNAFWDWLRRGARAARSPSGSLGRMMAGRSSRDGALNVAILG